MWECCTIEINANDTNKWWAVPTANVYSEAGDGSPMDNLRQAAMEGGSEHTKEIHFPHH